MPSPKTTHARPPTAQLQRALSQIGGEIEDQPLRSSSLARIMRETFGGSDAGGAWDWRMAYDMMQAAAVMQLVRGTGPDAVSAASMLAARLLTETRRSEQQIRLQQFSTPLAYAALAARAAAIRTGETVLEPSAGTGALAAFAARAGGTLLLNEIDPFRRALLETVFRTEVTAFDAEHIDDLLTTIRSAGRHRDESALRLLGRPVQGQAYRGQAPHRRRQAAGARWPSRGDHADGVHPGAGRGALGAGLQDRQTAPRAHDSGPCLRQARHQRRDAADGLRQGGG